MLSTHSADTIRKHSNLLSFFLSLTCLLFFVFLQTKVHADDTPFTVILQRKIPQGGEELQTVQALYNGDLAEGYVIGPMAMQDGSRYTLELQPSSINNGVIALLRSAPAVNTTAMSVIKRSGVIGTLNLFSTGGRYYYQMLDSTGKPDSERMGIPTLQQGTVSIVHYRQYQSSYALPDPIAVMQLILSNSGKRETGGEDELTNALSKLSLGKTPAECLLSFVDSSDARSGLARGSFMPFFMPVHSLNGLLQQVTPKISLYRTSAQGSSEVFAYSPHPGWPDNVITMPFFVEGEGNIQVPYGTTTIKGSLCYLDISEQQGNIRVDLRPLNRPTVVTSLSGGECATEYEAIHILPDNITVKHARNPRKVVEKRGAQPDQCKTSQGLDIQGREKNSGQCSSKRIRDGEPNSSALIDMPSSKRAQHYSGGAPEKRQLENHQPVFKSSPSYASFKNKVDHLDYEVLVNLIIGWPYNYQEQHQSNSFDCQQNGVDRRVFPGNSFVTTPLTIGFKDSHIHTYMMSHPTNPAIGLETGGIQLTNPVTQKQGSYSFVVSSHSHDSFQVSMHSLVHQKSTYEHLKERAQALLCGRSDALVTLYAQFTNENTMAVELINRQGKKLLSETVTVDWNPEKNIFSVLPLPINGSNSEWISLPGIATCINLLSHAITGELDAVFDASLLPDIYHRQASTDVNHPKGAYFSKSVYRDFTTVTPYRKNALWRHTVYGAKLVGASALWVWNHPGISVAGATITAAVAASSIMYPKEAGQFLQYIVERHGPSVGDGFFPAPTSSRSSSKPTH